MWNLFFALLIVAFILGVLAYFIWRANEQLRNNTYKGPKAGRTKNSTKTIDHLLGFDEQDIYE